MHFSWRLWLCLASRFLTRLPSVHAAPPTVPAFTCDNGSLGASTVLESCRVHAQWSAHAYLHLCGVCAEHAHVQCAWDVMCAYVCMYVCIYLCVCLLACMCVGCACYVCSCMWMYMRAIKMLVCMRRSTLVCLCVVWGACAHGCLRAMCKWCVCMFTCLSMCK